MHARASPPRRRARRARREARRPPSAARAEDAERRGRADAQRPRGAERGVDGHRHERRVEADLDGQPGDRGVGHRLRDHDRGGREPGHDVGPQPGPLVAGQPSAAGRGVQSVASWRTKSGPMGPWSRFGWRLGLPAAAQCAIELDEGAHLLAPHLGELQLLVEELLVRVQDLEVVREAGVVARARPARLRRAGRRRRFSSSSARLAELLDRDQGVRHLAIGVEGRLLVLGRRLLEPGLRRVVVPPDPVRPGRSAGRGSGSPARCSTRPSAGSRTRR